MFKLLNRASLFVVALIGMLCLHRLALHAAKEPEPQARSVVAVGFQTVWASQKLIDFAKKHDVLTSADDLERLIKESNFEGTWYAVKNRFYFDNGEVEDLPKLIVEKDWFTILAPTRHVLELLAGRSLKVTHEPIIPPQIIILDEGIFKHEPNRAFLALLEQSR